MLITKRNGDLVSFNPTKISVAISKAFRQSKESSDILSDTQKITQDILNSLSFEGNITVEFIQDLVEVALMKNQFYKTAKIYILYRSERTKLREKLVSDDLSSLVKKNSQYFDNDCMREFMFYRTYSRWIPAQNRREVWEETVDRYMSFMRSSLGHKLLETEYNEVKQAILNQDVMPSMRLAQFSGPAAERCNVCVYNCAFTAPETFKDLTDIMYISMCGTGVGFSVEAVHVEKFPVIQKKRSITHNFVIQDSKEGWCDAFEFGLNKWYEGEDVNFDYSLLRPAGARLKTMGGRSSGPQPLIDLMEFTRDTIFRRQGYKLSPLNMYDIICKIGQIVVSGGVRRSAMISLSGLSDLEIRDAKKGAFWNNYPQRSMANNSAVYNEKPTMIEFMNEWLALAESGTGERGIFNRGDLNKTLPQRRLEVLGSDVEFLGCNPCVTADTWVHTVNGPRQVSDLIDIPTDLIVNGQVHCSTGFFYTGRKPVYEVKTKMGYKLKLTNNHKLLNQEQWIELAELKVGDEIALSNHQSSSGWVGEGNFSEGWFYDGNEEETLDDLEKKSSEFQRGFLRNMLDVYGDDLDGNGYVLNLVEPEFLECVQRMLLRFGIKSSVDKGCLHFTGINATRYWHLTHIKSDNTINTEPFIDTIVGITPLGEEEVYDVTVEGVHEFCANGIRAHNCGEILLKPMQFCNLSEVICRPKDNLMTLMQKARIATIIGTYQASLTDFKYISPKWKQNQDQERLLGVSLTGQWDCDAVRSEYAFEQLRRSCIDINQYYADRLGINRSTCITCIKPSGSVSQLTNSSSGIHPRFSPYYIRRIRISATDPLLKLMRDQGYPCHPEVGQSEQNANTFVLDFPVKSPEGSICASDLGAIEQLEYWKKVKVHFTEHNPSVTIYIKPDEWLVVAQWVWDNWEYITGLSFLPYSDHIYQLAPYEKITKEQYEEFKSRMNPIDFSKLIYYETTDSTDVKREVACAGGVCEL